MSREAEIRARCDAATAGPWKQRHYHPDSGCDSAFTDVVEQGHAGDEWRHTVARALDLRDCTYKNYGTARNAEFIAHARDDVPYLLDRVAALEAQLADTDRAIRARIAALTEDQLVEWLNACSWPDEYRFALVSLLAPETTEEPTNA